MLSFYWIRLISHNFLKPENLLINSKKIVSTCIIFKGDTPLRSFDTSISYFYGLDVTVAFGLPLLLFELTVPSPVSLLSTDLRSRNKLAASLILLNSIQKALTSIAISLILMLLLRMSDCKNTQTYNKTCSR